MNGNVKTYTISGEHAMDVTVFLQDKKEDLLDHLTELIAFNAQKWYIVLSVNFIKYDSDGEEIKTLGGMTSEITLSFQPYELEDQISEAYDCIKNKVTTFLREGSGWSVDSVESLELRSAIYKPIGGSSYIPLSRDLMLK
jgi:hypothetical protein